MKPAGATSLPNAEPTRPSVRKIVTLVDDHKALLYAPRENA
jgi:hypothetical protein